VAELPPPPEGIVLAHFIVSGDVERSRRFYTEVLGGRVAFSGPGGLTYVALSNSWIIINAGGGPTDDKPAATGGSDGLELHQLRHSAATHLGDQKVPLQLIMAKTRHKSPRTVMRYVRPGDAAVTEVTSLLAPPRRSH
jgi:integrase